MKSSKGRNALVIIAVAMIAASVFISCGTDDFTENESAESSNSNTYHNGYEYVDLGLPSGLKWATCNVGASAPEEYGDYYAWGETETKTWYYYNTYKWYVSITENGETYKGFTKYVSHFNIIAKGYKNFSDDKTNLEADDDVAHVKWGGNWRMPTRNELIELMNNCTWIWTSLNGKNGYEIRGHNGKSIFLPTAGYRRYGSLSSEGSYGYYWSSSLDSYVSDCAQSVEFSSGWSHKDLRSDYRFLGRSVRPVTE